MKNPISVYCFRITQDAISCLAKLVAPVCGEEAATLVRRLYANAFKLQSQVSMKDSDCDFAAGEDNIIIIIIIIIFYLPIAQTIIHVKLHN